MKKKFIINHSVVNRIEFIFSIKWLDIYKREWQHKATCF